MCANCTPCDKNFIYGSCIKICQKSKGKGSCQGLHLRAKKGTITPSEMILTVKKKVRGDKKAEAALREVEKFLKRVKAEKTE